MMEDFIRHYSYRDKVVFLGKRKSLKVALALRMIWDAIFHILNTVTVHMNGKMIPEADLLLYDDGTTAERDILYYILLFVYRRHYMAG